MKYIGVVDTAKLVRAALKESFAGVKFSVTSESYAGGASINIKYTNGPTEAQVNEVISNFKGSYFDGMIDYKGSNYANLNGEEVKFGADFIFIRRNYSVEFLTDVANQVAIQYAVEETFEIANSVYSGAYVKGCDKVYLPSNRYFASQVSVAASQISLCNTQPSKTVSSVYSMGDDGYGQGCVGRLTTQGE
jgi:hypothetical protein